VDVLAEDAFRLASLSDDELRSALARLQAWKVKLGLDVQAGDLWPSAAGGDGQRLETILARCQRLGGKISYVTMLNACAKLRPLSGPDSSASILASFIAQQRTRHPEMIFGLGEAYPGVPAAELTVWLARVDQELASHGGPGLDFFRLKFDWADERLLALGQERWSGLKAIEHCCWTREIRFGLVFWAATQDRLAKLNLASDASWYLATLHQAHEYLYFSRFFPDQIVLQGGEQAHCAVLPETDEWTFTRLVRDFSRRILSTRVLDEVSLYPPVGHRTGNLLLDWDFQQDPGKTASDLSGHGIDLPLKNVRWEKTGERSGIGMLKGAALAIENPRAHIPLENAYTLICWLYPRGLGNNARLVQWSQRFVLRIEPGRERYVANLSANKTSVRLEGGEEAVKYRSWQHVAVVWDGQVLQFWLNGELVSQIRAPCRMDVGTDEFMLGRGYDGLIGGVKLYQSALPARVIHADYLKTRKPVENSGRQR
jgi:hypothetical protein